MNAWHETLWIALHSVSLLAFASINSAGYKQESLKLAAQVGVAKAAKQLGVHEPQLYAWRKQSGHAKTVSERESGLAVENARLKRQRPSRPKSWRS